MSKDEDLASPNNIRLLDNAAIEDLRALARAMRNDLRTMGEVISEEVLFKERLLATTVTKLLQHASDPNISLEEAVKVLTVAVKAHSEWQGSVAPIARKLGEDIRKMKREQLEGGGSGKALQPRPVGRLGDGGSRGNGRRSTGTSRTSPDAREAGVPGSVVERPVGVPDGDRSEYEPARDSDDRPEGQAEPD